jgi:hypothetical protein
MYMKTLGQALWASSTVDSSAEQKGNDIFVEQLSERVLSALFYPIKSIIVMYKT